MFQTNGTKWKWATNWLNHAFCMHGHGSLQELYSMVNSTSRRPTTLEQCYWPLQVFPVTACTEAMEMSLIQQIVCHTLEHKPSDSISLKHIPTHLVIPLKSSHTLDTTEIGFLKHQKMWDPSPMELSYMCSCSFHMWIFFITRTTNFSCKNCLEN